MTLKRVLIAEDDPDIASTLARGLSLEGYEATVAHDGESAIAVARQTRCDAAVVDMMLGDDRGEDLVRRLRRDGMSGPILILSALSSVEDRTSGLDAGADDYIAKPFEFAELMTRFKVHEQRRERDAAACPSYANLVYDPEIRTVRNDDRSEALTEREGELLMFLMRNAGRVVTRGEIFDTLWAKEAGGSENVVDVYLGYLRRKLAPMSDFGVALKTIRSRGFLLTEHEDET